MEYLPDVYQHFEQAFPQVHQPTRTSRTACYEGEEVRHVGLFALTTIGFRHTVAALSWIEEVIEAAK
jgi:hypothetical protein